MLTDIQKSMQLLLTPLFLYRMKIKMVDARGLYLVSGFMVITNGPLKLRV